MADGSIGFHANILAVYSSNVNYNNMLGNIDRSGQEPGTNQKLLEDILGKALNMYLLISLTCVTRLETRALGHQ